MFTQAEMQQALAVVTSEDDWRDPITALIEDPGPRNLECLSQAIVHFTGSMPHIVMLDDGIISVQALGYWAVTAMTELDYLH